MCTGLSKITRLEVGCGELAKGDVNVDLFPEASILHRGGKPLSTHTIRNFVKADAQHLPFMNETFEEARASHVIEHVSNPELLLTEMLRVTKTLVVIRCPHRLGEKKRNPAHLYHFNIKWFADWAKKNRVYCRGSTVDYRFWPNRLLRLIWIPYEIQVELRHRDFMGRRVPV